MAIFAALQGQMPLQEKWIRILAAISGLGAGGLIRYQSDYRFDLLLRAMENEALLRIQNPSNTAFSFAADIQAALSRYWLLSTYELLRTAKSSKAGRSNAKLQATYRQFQLVRVPITKLEIANDKFLKDPVALHTHGEGPVTEPTSYSSNSKSEYHPPMVTSTISGSLGWIVIDAEARETKIIFRRELSDMLLGFLD